MSLIILTKCQIFYLKCTKFIRPRLCCRSSLLPRPLAGFGGGEGEAEGELKGKGKGMKGSKRGEKGKGWLERGRGREGEILDITSANRVVTLRPIRHRICRRCLSWWKHARCTMQPLWWRAASLTVHDPSTHQGFERHHSVILRLQAFRYKKIACEFIHCLFLCVFALYCSASGYYFQ